MKRNVLFRESSTSHIERESMSLFERFYRMLRILIASAVLVVTSLTITACPYHYEINIDDATLPNPSVIAFDPEKPNNVPAYDYIKIFVTAPESESGPTVWEVWSDGDDPVAAPNPLVFGKTLPGFKTHQAYSGLKTGLCYRLLLGSVPKGNFNFCITNDNELIRKTFESPEYEDAGK